MVSHPLSIGFVYNDHFGWFPHFISFYDKPKYYWESTSIFKIFRHQSIGDANEDPTFYRWGHNHPQQSTLEHPAPHTFAKAPLTPNNKI